MTGSMGQMMISMFMGNKNNPFESIFDISFDDDDEDDDATLVDAASVFYLHSCIRANISNQNLLIENCKFCGKNDANSIVRL